MKNILLNTIVSIFFGIVVGVLYNICPAVGVGFIAYLVVLHHQRKK